MFALFACHIARLPSAAAPLAVALDDLADCLPGLTLLVEPFPRIRSENPMQDFDGSSVLISLRKVKQRREIPRISGPGLDSRTIARPISKNRARKKDFRTRFSGTGWNTTADGS